MFDLDVSAWNIAARTAVVYVALLVGLRLAGKRELGQMTPFDLAVVLLIANAVQNAMVGPDTSVTGGLIAAGVLLAVNRGVAFGRDRISWFRRVVEGTPTLLVDDGRLLTDHLRREGLDEDEVLMALREHGFADLKGIRMAVLETDGSISIIPKQGRPSRTRRHVRFTRRGI
ncbi:MAG TPA: YetF domain-containing protein [Dehalococcoidia bacterium]|nr:YetF domain-containing protein [Dehalococcoidia bacterium]